MEPRPARLWILDDDQQLCQLLAEHCQACGWTLDVFAHPQELEDALATGSPDLLLLDQMLPEKLGTDVVARLRQTGQRFPVLMLSALGAPSDRILGLENGADDYLGKPFLFRELQLRVKRLLESRTPEEPAPLARDQAFRIGDLLFDPHQPQISGQNSAPLRLTRGDTALLQAFCRRPRQVLSRADLGRASGSLVDPNQSRSIDMRLSRLRRLLSDLRDGQEAIVSVRGQGYQLVLPVQIVPLDG